jgi:hypothetical protein
VELYLWPFDAAFWVGRTEYTVGMALTFRWRGRYHTRAWRLWLR